MAAALLSVPIRPWVPRWLGILTAFVIMLPVILINGAYTGSAVEISSTLGVLGEDIRMGPITPQQPGSRSPIRWYRTCGRPSRPKPYC